jgi:hypothetical protein
MTVTFSIQLKILDIERAALTVIRSSNGSGAVPPPAIGR